MISGCAESCLTVILSLSDPWHANLGNLGTPEVNNSIINLFYSGETILCVCLSPPFDDGKLASAASAWTYMSYFAISREFHVSSCNRFP